jgi:ubiquinone/menaquinone biosynthesis C-methylase UbiE
MSIVKTMHNRLVYSRRMQLLAEKMSRELPAQAKILDVGCGDGKIDALIMQKRPDVVIEGIDVLVRPQTHIPVTAFDGNKIPHPDGSFDVVMFIDVLHHCLHPEQLLEEAKRVAKKAVLLKDHAREGILAGPTLRFMDWFGNAHHGVSLPYNYWSRSQWDHCLQDLGLKVGQWHDRLELYPWPATWFFDRRLHFIASLERAA